jgi:hypothetical protein
MTNNRIAKNTGAPEDRTQHNPGRFLECIPTLLIIDNSILCGSPFTGIFALRQMLWRPELMSKRVSDDRPKKDRPMTEEATPPLLSEKLIAQLQGAVDAAQRKQLPQPNDASASRSAEKEV